MPSWVIQQNGGIDASAPRISGVSKRSVMNSAWERVIKLISGSTVETDPMVLDAKAVKKYSAFLAVDVGRGVWKVLRNQALDGVLAVLAREQRRGLARERRQVD